MKKIHLGVFEIFAIFGASQGLWTHPDHTNTRFNDLNYWIDLANLLEKGKFDFLFLADSYGFPEINGQVPDAVFREGVDFPQNDPMVLISAMASVTEKLGFVVTASTTYEMPYANARRFSTLDHLTKGRIGWNIVTSGHKTAAAHFGKEFVAHDNRYEIAEEFMEVSYKLWEGSWEDDAVLADKKNRTYADPTKVHRVVHEGKHFRLSGYHKCEPSMQRTPLLFQAGSSSRGVGFAGKHAECIFLQHSSQEKLKEKVQEIREEAKKQGRDPSVIKCMLGLSVVVAPTTEEALIKLDGYKKAQNQEAQLAHYSGLTGIDLTSYNKDQGFENIRSEQSTSLIVRSGDQGNTIGKAIEEYIEKGLRGFILVGNPVEVADQIQDLVEATDLDGFLLEPYVVPGTYQDFIELVVPILQQRNMFRNQYEEETFRERLYGEGAARLPDDHPGACYRKSFVEG